MLFVSSYAWLSSTCPSAAALMTSAVKIARVRPVKSSASSERTRSARLPVSTRRRKEMPGGRWRRMSYSPGSRRTASCASTGGACATWRVIVLAVGRSGIVPTPTGPARPATDSVGTPMVRVRSACSALDVRGERGPISLFTTPQVCRCSGRVAGGNAHRYLRPGGRHAIATRMRVGSADEHLGARRFDRALQALAQGHLRRPAEQLARQRDVRPALLGIVDGQRLEDDLRARGRDLLDRLRQLQQRELVGVADGDRVVVAGLRERDDAADQVTDVA